VRKLAIRRPAFAGAFYAASSKSLKNQIEECFKHKLGPKRLPYEQKNTNIIGVICPHAGFAYSGPSAAHGYLEIGEQKPPKTVVIIGPNHTGWGTPLSIMRQGVWKTPLGEITIDSKLADKIIEFSNSAKDDDTAFIREHSIEVQLPFLQYIYSNFKFVPICMGYQDLETSTDLGQAIFNASKSTDIMLIASSDLSHQESISTAYKKDQFILDSILEIDEVKLQQMVKKYNISTCGYGPISSLLVYSKLKGATESEILSYYTSGDIIGDHRGVVGYTSAKITRNR
jgi:AmmeMemoRadiSam system protein B